MNIKAKVFNKIVYTMTLSLIAHQSMFAQGADQDFLRSTGKIYGVIAAVVLIFLGIAFYLWRLDNKITKLEKHLKQGE